MKMKSNFITEKIKKELAVGLIIILFAIFIERNLEFLKKNGFTSLITMQSWMFLSVYEKLREKILNQKNIISMVHLGTRAFDSIGGEVVSTTAFTLQNCYNVKMLGSYVRLVRGKSEKEKKKDFRSSIEHCDSDNFFNVSGMNFNKIPGSPIAYWVKNKLFKIFETFSVAESIALPKQGSTIGNNDRFLRLWFELRSPFAKKWKKTHLKISLRKFWIPVIMFIKKWVQDY